MRTRHGAFQTQLDAETPGGGGSGGGGTRGAGEKRAREEGEGGGDGGVEVPRKKGRAHADLELEEDLPAAAEAHQQQEAAAAPREDPAVVTRLKQFKAAVLQHGCALRPATIPTAELLDIGSSRIVRVAPLSDDARQQELPQQQQQQQQRRRRSAAGEDAGGGGGGDGESARGSIGPLRVVPEGAAPDCAVWFDMSSVSAFEARALPEFFTGRIPEKTPELYMQARNYMVQLWRERVATTGSTGAACVTATECRRRLAVDAGAVLRIHELLETYGIINYGYVPHGQTAPLAAPRPPPPPTELWPTLNGGVGALARAQAAAAAAASAAAAAAAAAAPAAAAAAAAGVKEEEWGPQQSRRLMELATRYSDWRKVGEEMGMEPRAALKRFMELSVADIISAARHQPPPQHVAEADAAAPAARNCVDAPPVLPHRRSAATAAAERAAQGLLAPLTAPAPPALLLVETLLSRCNPAALAAATRAATAEVQRLSLAAALAYWDPPALAAAATAVAKLENEDAATSSGGPNDSDEATAPATDGGPLEVALSAGGDAHPSNPQQHDSTLPVKPEQEAAPDAADHSDRAPSDGGAGAEAAAAGAAGEGARAQRERGTAAAERGLLRLADEMGRAGAPVLSFAALQGRALARARHREIQAAADDLVEARLCALEAQERRLRESDELLQAQLDDMDRGAWELQSARMRAWQQPLPEADGVAAGGGGDSSRDAL